jgi:hypothetical protein
MWMNWWANCFIDAMMFSMFSAIMLTLPKRVKIGGELE